MIRLSGARYKEISRPRLATARGSIAPARYTDLKFVADAGGVRITGRRQVERRSFKGSYSLLIKPDSSGSWKILEERGEVVP